MEIEEAVPSVLDPAITTDLENTEDICYFCHKSYDPTIYEKSQSELPVDNIHKICCQYFKPEYLSESFLTWDPALPLPFCKKCLFLIRKLCHMNDELEAIQKKIYRFVNTFTVDFLKSRTNICNSKFLSLENEYGPEETTPAYDDANGRVTIKQEQAESTENPVDCDLEMNALEDIYSGYDSNEDMPVPPLAMKQESIYHPPVIRRGRGRPRKSDAQKATKTSKTNSKKKFQPKSARVNSRRMDFDLDGNPIPNSNSLPRRKAAVKAEATFSNWAEELSGEVMDTENVPAYTHVESSDKNDYRSGSEESTSSWKMMKEEKRKRRIMKKQQKVKRSGRGRPPKIDSFGEERNFKCAQCDKTYKNRHHLIEHEITHDESKRFECTLCGQSFSYVRNLRKHLIRHGKNEPLDKRKIRKLSGEKQKKVPKNRDGKPRTYVCKICTKVCNTAGHLFYHSQSHKNSDGEFKCELCNKIFKNAVTFQKHGRIHTGENKFLCSVCGKEFKSRSGQKDHELLHFEDKNERLNRKDFECQVCHKTYSSKSSLNKHSFRHLSEKQFACQECGKRFATKGGLQTHMIYHKGERPFLCEECGKSFFTKTKLNEHNRIHTGMLFPCEYCDKGFQTTTHLKQHYRSHNRKINEAQETVLEHIPTIFQCPTCELKFDTQNSLSNHLLIHTEEFSRFLMFSNN